MDTRYQVATRKIRQNSEFLDFDQTHYIERPHHHHQRALSYRIMHSA